MYRWRIIGIVIILILLRTTANAIPVLVVAGKLKGTDGRAVTEKFNVRVVNKVRNLEANAESSVSGGYAVTLIAMNSGESSVAEAGDSLDISVLDKDGKIVANESYQIKESDVASTKVSLDLVIPSKQLTTPVFVVSGIIKNKDGKPVGAGVNVQVSNAERQIAANAVTNTNGQYIVTLIKTGQGEELIAAGTGDTIVVKAIIGSSSGSKNLTLSTENILKGYACVDVNIEGGGGISVLRFVIVGGKAADPAKRLQFYTKEGYSILLPIVMEGGNGQLSFSASPLPDGAKFEEDKFYWTPGYDIVKYGEKPEDFDLILDCRERRSEGRTTHKDSGRLCL